MKLSIIIPCYNCSKTIGRLLDSIVNNDLEKEEYEVIIVDDKSTDDFLDIVKTYENKMNIVYTTTIRDFHCPGNTRQTGIPLIKGEWFTFIDNDDIFESNIFQAVFQTIAENQIQYVLSTSFTRYLFETEETFDHFKANPETNTWLHGKFYNKKNILDKLHIHFKEDLFSHEDLYFNLSIEAALSSLQEDIFYAPELYTYKWIYRQDSLSNIKTGNLLYIEYFFEDYIQSTSEPYFNYINDINKEWVKQQLFFTMLMGYFYIQGGIYRIGDNYPKRNKYILAQLQDKICEQFNITKNDIINFIYNSPKEYHHYKEMSFGACHEFIENQSFRDFILNL